MTANILQLCGVEVPVFQAGLGGVAGPELAAAVSNAGGLGHLGCIRRSASAVREWINETRDLTDRPFGVNLVPKGPGPDGFDAQLNVVLEEKPKVLSLFWGDFSQVIPRARAAGIVTMVQIGSVAEALKAAADGADIIIAQGIEAGGHVRGTVGLSVLLPEVIRAVAPKPVLAAGGICSRNAVKTVLEQGAAGAWVGTRFVATMESLAHDIYKTRLVEAGTDDTVHGHFYSYGWPIGTAYRVIPPRSKNLLRFVAGGARRIDRDRNAEGLSLYAGQGVGQIDQVVSAAQVVAELCDRS
ncbi:MAG: nitronate monooxygenase [Gammaproteobacteria bacterium]|nr:nitronate monooxygenase [Gammaproteobacteria bacterium]